MTALGSLMIAALQSPPDPQSTQFFTIDTLFTAAGATTAVITVTAVLHSLFAKLQARWFALVFSLFLTFAGIGVKQEGYGAASLLLAVINAFVIYAAAVGVNNVSTAAPASGSAAAPSAPGPPRRSYRWWP
jgi:hypothetical protein